MHCGAKTEASGSRPPKPGPVEAAGESKKLKKLRRLPRKKQLVTDGNNSGSGGTNDSLVNGSSAAVVLPDNSGAKTGDETVQKDSGAQETVVPAGNSRVAQNGALPKKNGVRRLIKKVNRPEKNGVGKQNTTTADDVKPLLIAEAPARQSQQSATTVLSSERRGLYSSGPAVSPPIDASGLEVMDMDDASGILRGPVNQVAVKEHAASAVATDRADTSSPADSADREESDLSALLRGPQTRSEPLPDSEVSELLRRPSPAPQAQSHDSVVPEQQTPKSSAVPAASDTANTESTVRSSDVRIIESAPEPVPPVVSSPLESPTVTSFSGDTVSDFSDIEIALDNVDVAAAPAAQHSDSQTFSASPSPPVSQQAQLQQAVTMMPASQPTPASSVPVIQMPIPQFVPVQMPISNSGDSAVDVPVTTETKKESSTKLPNPDDTGAEIAVPDELDNADSEEANRTDESDSPQENRERQKKAAQAYRFFQKQLSETEILLQKRQEPFVGRAPRLLSKHIAQLENSGAADSEEILKQLRLISRSRSPAAVETFREYSVHRSDEIRAVCAEGLAGIEDVSAALVLLKMLPDGVSSVVDIAFRGLVHQQHEETVPPLLALALVHPRLRAVLRDEITEMDAERKAGYVDPLTKALKTKTRYFDYPALALHLLSRICDSDQLKTYTAYSKHPAPELRVAALDALAYTGEKQAVRIFNKTMEDPAPRVRSAAASALTKLHSPKSITLLIAALRDPEASVRRSAAKTLTGIESAELAKPASAALKTENDPTTVEYLLEILGRGGTDEALVTLKKYVQGDDVEMCHRAVTTLRRLKNPKGAKLLVPLLESPDRDTRRLAVEALGQLGQKSVVSGIRGLLKSDPHDQVRAAAARALGELRDAESLPLLEELLSEGTQVQMQAVIAMGAIGSEEAIPALLAQLRHTATEVRYHACNALAQIGNLANTDPVAALLDDNDAMVRRGAEAALKKLGAAPTSSRWSRAIKRSVAGFGAMFVPGSLAGGVPGGTKGLLAVSAMAIIAVVGFAGRGLLSAVRGPGAGLPVTRISTVTVSPSGDLAYASRSNKVAEVWDLKEGRLLDRFRSPFFRGAVFNTAGDQALVFSPKGVARYSVADGYSTSLEQEMKASGEVTGRFFPADQKSVWLATSEGDGSKLTEYDLATLEPGRSKTVSTVVSGRFALTPALDMLLVVEGDKVWLFTGQELKKSPKPIQLSFLVDGEGGQVTDVCFNHDGSLMALASEKQAIVLELPAGEVKAVVFGEQMGQSRISRIRFTDNSSTLVAVSQGCRTFQARNEFSEISVQDAPSSGAMSVFSLTPDFGMAVYAEDESKDLVVVDLQNSSVVHSLKGKL